MTRNPVLQPAQPGDDLDGLLRAFYQAQLPSSWPAPPQPAPSLRPLQARRSRRAWLRTRLALAASVLLLIACSLWLSSRPLDTAPVADLPVLTHHSASNDGRVKRHTGKTTSPRRSQAQAGAPEPMKTLNPVVVPPMK
jgi:hypothetical protein